MKKLDIWRTLRPLSALALVLLLASCSTTSPEAKPTDLEVQRAKQQIDWREEVIYFAFTDRFANGDASNDDALSYPGSDRDLGNPLGWHGGDFAGITQKIKEGYFERLGVTAIWISPVVLQVPAIGVADGPNEGERFAGYHGYWAEDFVQTDPHFGTLKELEKLVKLAHAHKLKVIQDVVVNHAGYGAPLVTENPEWFNSEQTCAASGNPTVDCPLAGLPDFDQSNPEVVAFLNHFIDYWVDEVGVDGLRMDTVKHVEDSYWEQFFASGGPGDPSRVWTVGELFTGDVGFIARYLDELGLPAAFDFPLYFRIKDHLSSPNGNLDDVAAVFDQDSVYSDPSRLVTFVDNHDVPRFMSEAISRGVSEENARERLDMALSFIYTVRGTPSVYYGTEIAMQGQGDPYNFLLGEANREDMDFSALAASSLDERLKALADARETFPALQQGVQQELWRPNGGAQIYAFRRVATGELPVVAVMNNADTAINLSDLPGGGIPLLGTFDPDGSVRVKQNDKIKICKKDKPKCAAGFIEVTGQATDLRVDSEGRLVGTVPARTLLAVAGAPGASLTPNPDLGNVTDLAALPGDGAVKLSWTPATDPDVQGYRVYTRASSSENETQYNFAPLPADAESVVVYGPANGAEVVFRVFSVDAQGRESTNAPTVRATPTAGATSSVTFTVDARSQGAASIEIRRFDTGGQLEYPMTEVEKGIWQTTLELPLFRELKFKFGNDAPSAKNAGYEGDGQGDRSLVLDAAEVTYEGTYDFISVNVPDAAVTGTVTAEGAPIGGATINSGLDARTYYAVSFADGSYYLPLPSAQATDLTASAPGYDEVQANVTAPATEVDFALGSDARTTYRIDGDLSDWADPRATLTNPGYDVGFGPDNLFTELLVDWDETNLYLAYRYRASGNAALLHIDSEAGGSTSAEGFDAWRRLASFDGGVDYFLAQYEGQGVQLREVVSSTQTSEITAQAVTATAGTSPAYSTEVAIPWTVLGFASRPDTTLDFYAGIYGGDGYGAGDIAPNENSDPAASGNTVTGFDTSRRVDFQTAFAVDVTP